MGDTTEQRERRVVLFYHLEIPHTHLLYLYNTQHVFISVVIDHQ